jgi:hypothetical protein
MKKIILVITAALMFSAVNAFAWHGGYAGKGEGGCPCPNGNGTFQNENGIGADINSFNAENAKSVLENSLKPKYKGYVFGDIESFSTPRGLAFYQVKATDSAGNVFVFFFGHRGHVRGPILESELPF